jgi:hypothetical protein
MTDTPTTEILYKHSHKTLSKGVFLARRWWLTPVIPATQEPKIRRITVRSHPGQIVLETLARKTQHKEELAEWLKV